MPNLEAHIKNAKSFGIPVVVAVNSFKDDTPAEVELVRKFAIEAGAEDAVVSRHWMEGGAGSTALGEAVVKACELPSDFKFLYPLKGTSIKDKIETICKEIYGADGVEYSEEAEKKIEILGADRARVRHVKDDVACVAEYAFAGEDVTIDTRIENNHPGEPIQAVGFGGLRFTFSRPPQGLMYVQHISYFQAHGIRLCHPSHKPSRQIFMKW